MPRNSRPGGGGPHRPRGLLRRLAAVGVSAALAATGLTGVTALTVVGLAHTAAADPTYDSRDAVTPVVAYTFDDDSGSTVTDSSAHGNNGSWSGTPAYAPGVSGRALHVSAAKNFVTLPRTAGQTDGSGSFSFETWWYDNTESSDAPIVANQNFASCANTGFTFYHLSGTYQQRACYGVGGTKTYTTTRTTSIQGGWHYLAAVEDATAHTWSYYVDGVLFSSNATNSGTTAANFDSGSPIRIGQDGTGAYSAGDDALVDDFNFYNQAISADQIAADYAATNPATHYPVTVTDDGHGTGSAAVLAPAAGATDTLTADPDPGYSFDSWQPVTPAGLAVGDDGTFTDPGTPVTVKAAFTPNSYTVAYDGNGADGGSTPPQKLTYDQPAALTANGFTDSGEQFTGWSTSPHGPPVYTDQETVQNLSTAQHGTVTLYAQWAAAGSYQVSVAGDSHTTAASSADATGGHVLPGATVTLTAQPDTGYTAAWQVVSPAGLTVAADGSFTMPSADVVLKAVSTPNRYQVVFDGNGATSGTTATETLTYGDTTALTADGYARTGYGFLGWAASATGPLLYTDGQQVTDLTAADGGTVTLHAVWGRLRAPGDTVAPVASYDFDQDKNGVVTDSSGQGENAAWTGTATYAKGLSGLAAHLTGGANAIALPKSPGLTDGSGSFSFSFWWGEYGETADGPLVSNQDFSACYDPGLSFYNVSGTTTTRACWGAPVNGTRQYSTTNPASIQGHWHYESVVVDRSAQTVSTYLDGKLFSTSTSGQTTGANFDSGLPFMIGQDGTGVYSASVDALVDDFDFYDQPLTAAQIADDYQATAPADTTLPDESTVDVTTPVSTVPNGFVTDTFHAPQVRTGDQVRQSVAGLWNGGKVTSYTKTGGDSWLDVSSDGTVTGTAPSSVPQHPGTITVEATDGTTTADLTVEVPVIGADDAPQVAAATWNLWDGGTHVDDSLPKDLAVIADNGLDVIGVQQDGGTVAHQLAQALGWFDYEGSDGLGIVSAWPIEADADVAATADAPATAVTVNALGQRVRVWDTALDEADYGPDLACPSASGGTTGPGSGLTPAQLADDERNSVRYRQAEAVAAGMGQDLAAASGTPVLLLGDLASPAASDWTAATASAHCATGPVDWPVPDVFTGAGLTDTFRQANPDPAADPGTTWSPIAAPDSTEPQDRVDYVYAAGAALHVLGSNTLVAGWPSSTDVQANAWTSDHAAVVTTFTLGDAQPPTGSAPTVTVAHDSLVYQAGHGPADDTALAQAIGATADPADAATALDSSDVDWSAPGWYTVLVTATAAKGGWVSAPVAVTVHVVPVTALTVANGTAALPGLGLTEAKVLAALGATLTTPGSVHVDLGGVDTGTTGSYPVTVTGTDDYGFTATAQAVVQVTSPDLPPVVTTAVQPGSADGQNGWYTAAPVLSAAATDDSGTAPTVEYRIGDGSWQPYPGPLTVPDGDWNYQFRATDNAGHTSAPVSREVRADTAPPTTTAAAAPGTTIIAPVTVTLSATDAASGVAATEYRIGDTGDWLTYHQPFTVTPQFSDQTVSYRSTDTAGNTEPVRSLTVPAIQPVAPAVTAADVATPYGTAAVVTVTVASPGLPVTGTVTLTEGGTARGTAALDASGSGSVQLTLPVGLAPGVHVLDAAYSGSDLLTPAVQTVAVTVDLPAAWNATTAYQTGAQVGYQGKEYVAAWYSKGQTPGADPNSAWEETTLTEDGTAVWTPSRIFDAGTLVSYDGKTWKADWYTRDQAPGDPTGPWEQQAAPGPDGIAPWTPTTVYQKGDTADYQGHTYQARWYTRDDTPGTADGPWQKLN